MPRRLCLLTAALTLSSSLVAVAPAASASTFPAPVNGSIAANDLDSESPFELSLVNPTEGTSSGLTPDSQEHADSSPVWSADGREVAYIRSYFTGAGHDEAIRIVSSDGTEREVFRTGQDLDDLAWSPDGSRFAMQVWSSNPDVYVVNADGSGFRLLPDPRYAEYHTFSPGWSPDGSKIAFVRGDDVFVINAGGSGETQITNECVYPENNTLETPHDCDLDEDGITRSYYRPNWHPGGSRLVVEVSVLNQENPSADEFFLGALPLSSSRASEIPGTSDAVRGAYSPDGRRLAYNAPGPGDSAGSQGSNLYIANADGSNRSSSLGRFHDPDWQPCPTGDCPRFGAPNEPPCRATAAVPPPSVRLELPSGPVTVTFAGVEGSGEFVVDECGTGGGGTDEQVFAFYDLSHTGFTFTSANVCLPYDEQAAADLGFAEDEIDLFHTQPDGTRKVITTGRDTTANIVCGASSSFSPFTIGIGAVNRSTVAACPPDRVPEDGFTDVPAHNPHEASIDCVLWWQIARGTSDSTYEPERSTSRAQMATFIAQLIRRAGGELPEGRDEFSDDNGDRHESNINALAAAGIVSGTGPNTFSPTLTVTRAQMATFIVRGLAHVTGTTPTTGIDFFTDDDVHGTHQSNINLVAAAGITAGTSTTAARYDPSGAVTRAQMATFLARMLDQLVNEGHASPPSS